MIVAGFGFRGSATVDSFADALDRAAGKHTVNAVATLEEKVNALTVFADARGFSVIPVAKSVAETQSTLTKSQASMAAKGLHSVAEACALAAAGPGARLLGPRVTSDDGRATCALAKGQT